MNEALPCRASWCVVKLHIAQATVRVDSLRVPPVRATCELRVQGLRRTRRHVSVRRSPHADTLRAGYPLRPQSGKTLAENSDTRAALLRSRRAHNIDSEYQPFFKLQRHRFYGCSLSALAKVEASQF